MPMRITTTTQTGMDNNYKTYSLTTHGTPSTEKNQDYGQAIYQIVIVNDSDTDIVFGFDNQTNVSGKTWTVIAGEILSVDLVHQILYYKSTGTNKAFRVFVVW